VKTSGAKTEPKSDEKPEVREPVADKPVSNGTLQVTTKDGAIVNINTEDDGWKDRVRELDPKNPIFKYER
jgi:hypothetical protein